MDPSELLRVAAEQFEALGIDYFVTGSMATITYGEPRFTNDVDIVARVKLGHVDALLKQYASPDFYCSRGAVIQAIESCRMFNIIHPTSGLKLDIMIPEDDAFNESRFERCRKLSVGEQMDVYFASPEDVILKKLCYFKQGGSENISAIFAVS
ncbi:MAG: hypothetical protein HUJ26_22470 [Planctomycetaceae bacterium]|nr:hypothetical protein [Planctomycetaceae bacterium]